MYSSAFFCRFFFFNDTATTEIYTLSLHDALPIYTGTGAGGPRRSPDRVPGIVTAHPARPAEAAVARRSNPKLCGSYRCRNADVAALRQSVPTACRGRSDRHLVRPHARSVRRSGSLCQDTLSGRSFSTPHGRLVATDDVRVRRGSVRRARRVPDIHSGSIPDVTRD